MDARSYEIIMLVEAETPQLARETAASQLTALCLSSREIHNWALTFLPPEATASEEGSALVEKYWRLSIVEWLEDLDVVSDTLNQAERDQWVSKVLENWGFRAANLRLGSLFGLPNRIYHLGVGVNNGSILDDLVNIPNMWAVTAVVD